MSAEENIAIARRWLTAGAMGAVELADETFAPTSGPTEDRFGTDGPTRNARAASTASPTSREDAAGRAFPAAAAPTRRTWFRSRRRDWR